MADQLELFQSLPVQQKCSSYKEKFEAFHALNPHVYRNLVRMARTLRAKNPNAKLGIAAIYHVLQWQYLIETTNIYFKLNHNLRSRYSRLIAAQEPDLRTMFETRKLRTEV